MRQIRQVSRLRAQVHISEEMLAQDAVEVARLVRARLADRIRRDAHPFAVEVDPRDVQFRDRPEAFGVTVLAWWQPDTQVVELRRGEHDGEVLAIRGAPLHPVRVAAMTGVDWSHPAEAPVTTRTFTYECVGWHEQERHWIYEATSL